MNDVALFPLTFLKYKVMKEIYLLRSNYMYNIYFDNHAIKSFLKTILKYNTIVMATYLIILLSVYKFYMQLINNMF